MPTDNWLQVGGLVGAALALLAAVLVVALHVVRTDVDPREDGVSAFALTRYGALYRAQVVATGAAALLPAFGLAAERFGGAGIVFLAVFGVSRIAIARYPTDPRGTTRLSVGGRRHVLLAATSFVTIAVAAPWISMTLAGDPGWRGPVGALVALGWATTILALGTFPTMTLPATRRFFGLVERGAYAGWLLWLLLLGLSIGGWA